MNFKGSNVKKLNISFMEAKDFIGTKQTLSGGVFGAKNIKETEFDVIDAKDCMVLTINTTTFKESKYRGVKLKLKNASMKKAQWTKKIPLKLI